MTQTPFRWACPQCRAPLVAINSSCMECSCSCSSYNQVNGIWRMLSGNKAVKYKQFVENYDKVRRDERWGNSDAQYYRTLPYRDLSGRHSDIWKVRAVSFTVLLQKVVHPFAEELRRPLRILDAGAGNGWLSYRLALEGHQLLASDLRVDAIDGLGACRWYGDQIQFSAVQATFEQIPLCDDELDLIIFNGSFHYASDYVETLYEALRALRPNGRLVVLDSPVYEHAHTGEQMVVELHKQLKQHHEIDPAVIDHENFLTPHRLKQLSQELHLSWRMIEPWYGWRWKLAPWQARLRGRRQPARFYVIAGERL